MRELKELYPNVKALGATVIMGGSLARPEFVSEGLCDAVFTSSKDLLEYLRRMHSEDAKSLKSGSGMPDPGTRRV
jgi:hypothetical protein